MHILKPLLLSPLLIARFYCGDALLFVHFALCCFCRTLALIKKTKNLHDFFFCLLSTFFFQTGCQMIAPESLRMGIRAETLNSLHVVKLMS